MTDWHTRNRTRWIPPDVSQLRELPGIIVQSLLGIGGMGAVYLARQVRENRQIALKIARPCDGRSKTYMALIVHEAHVIAQLDHPHIIREYDFGLNDDIAWIALELIQGRSMRDLIRTRRMPLGYAIGLIRQVCAGLGHAHARGIVHHDLKPENILVDESGNAKIFDFGLATVRNSSYTISRPGKLSGTLRYMAPEQLAHPNAIDHRIDLYAIGVMLYEIVTGRTLGGAYPPVFSIEGKTPIDQVMRRCLERNPDDRWQSAGDLLDALHGIACDGPPNQKHLATPTNLSRNISSVFEHRPGGSS